MEPSEYVVPKNLAKKIAAAPKAPGCYLFYDYMGNIIYVGKAKLLYKRVKSYFTKTARTNEDMQIFLRKITHVEYHITASELDALMLEYRLIKKYKPWFNSQLKPDKLRPYLRLAPGAPYATLSVAQSQCRDGAVYYNFFTDEEDVKSAIRLLGRVWGTPQCGLPSFKNVVHSCLYHSMGQCTAPCQNKADVSAYASAVEEIRQFLQGKPVAAMDALKTTMAASAENLNFEKAAECRELLNSLHILQRKCRKTYHLPKDKDSIIFIRPYREPSFSVFYAKEGVVLHRGDFSPETFEEMLPRFILQIQTGTPALEDGEHLAACLTEILADKFFVPLSKKCTVSAIAKAMQKSYVLFQN